MHRPRCSAKLPNMRGFTSPTTRSGAILMRAVAGVGADWAPTGGEASKAARTAAHRDGSRRCRFIDSTPSRELLGAHDSRPFANDDELAGLDAGRLLRGPARPADGDVRGGRGPQPEVQAPVVRGVEA